MLTSMPLNMASVYTLLLFTLVEVAIGGISCDRIGYGKIDLLTKTIYPPGTNVPPAVEAAGGVVVQTNPFAEIDDPGSMGTIPADGFTRWDATECFFRFQKASGNSEAAKNAGKCLDTFESGYF